VLRPRRHGRGDVADPEERVLHPAPIPSPFYVAVESFLNQQPLNRVHVLGADETAAFLGDERDEFAVLRVVSEDFPNGLLLGALTTLMLGAVPDHGVDARGPRECPFERNVSERRSNALLT
jgi:hypothetical protein